MPPEGARVRDSSYWRRRVAEGADRAPLDLARHAVEQVDVLALSGIAAAGRDVCVLERGKAYPPGSFPRGPRDFAANFWNPSAGLYGLFNVWSFTGLDSVVASGLGGGSLIYANVMLRKPDNWFRQPHPYRPGVDEVWSFTGADLAAFQGRMRDWPAVRECWTLSGDIDFVLDTATNPDRITAQIKTAAVGSAEAAALDAGDVTTGSFADARINGAAESDEITGLTDSQISDTLTASTSTTAAAEDNDTSIATTAYVQGEFADLGAYTVGSSAPVDGTTACTNGDMYLDESANKIYFCVDSATDDWFGVALTDTP